MTPTETIVVVLIDRMEPEEDKRVVREARTLASSADAAIVLVHVARPVLYSIPRGTLAAPRIEPWEQMRAIEATVEYYLRGLAGKLLGDGRPVKTLVHFGDPVQELQQVALTLGAVAVVAASRPGRRLPWRSRDRRLIQALDVPVVLVNAALDRGQPAASAAIGARA